MVYFVSFSFHHHHLSALLFFSLFSSSLSVTIFLPYALPLSVFHHPSHAIILLQLSHATWGLQLVQFVLADTRTGLAEDHDAGAIRSLYAVVEPRPVRRSSEPTFLSSGRAASSSKTDQGASYRPSHLPREAYRNPLRFRSPLPQSKGTTGKPPTLATRRNLRKSIPRPVAPGMNCQNF